MFDLRSQLFRTWFRLSRPMTLGVRGVVENASGLSGRLGVGDAESAARLSELDDLARKNRVSERLEQIKQRGGKK